MTMAMTTDEYTAKLEMLADRTSFNDAALEDAFIQGLPQSILFTVYLQTSLPSGLDNWKTVVHNLDCLHWGFSQAEAVNLSNLNTDPSNTDSTDTDPHSHPHTRHLSTYGHRPEPTQA